MHLPQHKLPHLSDVSPTVFDKSDKHKGPQANYTALSEQMHSLAPYLGLVCYPSVQATVKYA